MLGGAEGPPITAPPPVSAQTLPGQTQFTSYYTSYV
jgi:hypothetical protein